MWFSSKFLIHSSIVNIDVDDVIFSLQLMHTFLFSVVHKDADGWIAHQQETIGKMRQQQFLSQMTWLSGSASALYGRAHTTTPCLAAAAPAQDSSNLIIHLEHI